MLPLFGPASRNRTHILEVEAPCIIHYTIARYLVRVPGVEPGRIKRGILSPLGLPIPPYSRPVLLVPIQYLQPQVLPAYRCCR